MSASITSGKSLSVTLSGTMPTLQSHVLVTLWARSSFAIGSETEHILAELAGSSHRAFMGVWSGDAPSGPGDAFCNIELATGEGGEAGIGYDVSDVWLFHAFHKPPNAASSYALTRFLGDDDSLGDPFTGTSATASLTSFAIGATASNAENWQGFISDAAIWLPTNLTQAQSIVDALCIGNRANNIPSIATPIKYWPLRGNRVAVIGGNDLNDNGSVDFDSSEPLFIPHPIHLLGVGRGA